MDWRLNTQCAQDGFKKIKLSRFGSISNGNFFICETMINDINGIFLTNQNHCYCYLE